MLRLNIASVTAIMVMITTVAFAIDTTSERHIVSQKNRRFNPKEITVQPGDVVVFQNDDKTDHHIFARSGPAEFDSELLPRGASFEVQLDETGRFKVGCRIHRRMTFDIVVDDSSEAQELEE